MKTVADQVLRDAVTLHDFGERIVAVFTRKQFNVLNDKLAPTENLLCVPGRGYIGFTFDTPIGKIRARMVLKKVTDHQGPVGLNGHFQFVRIGEEPNKDYLLTYGFEFSNGGFIRVDPNYQTDVPLVEQDEESARAFRLHVLSNIVYRLGGLL